MRRIAVLGVLGLLVALLAQAAASAGPPGMPDQLNGPLPAGGNVSSGLFDLDVVVSADSSRVIYRADQDTDEVFELYSVPIGGGTPTKLNGALAAGGDVNSDLDFVVSPDSTRVIYRADQDTNDVFELYSVPIDGGTPTKLNGTLPPRRQRAQLRGGSGLVTGHLPC